jgi:hypothetical protein
MLMVTQSAACLPDLSQLYINGYTVFDFFNPFELEFIRSTISNRICELNGRSMLSSQSSQSKWSLLLSEYSEEVLFDHSKIADKRKRMLSEAALVDFFSFDSVVKLTSLIGEFQISGEESRGDPEVYWRLVRPNQPGDVGPLHADGWFWHCNSSWHRPARPHRRWKVWVAVENERGSGGLKVVPGSHLRQDISYDIRFESGKNKPMIVDPHGSINASSVLLNVSPGQAVLFDDSLVHGGAASKGRLPRVSLEFTCLAFSEVSGK